jgi:hypothetical protein
MWNGWVVEANAAPNGHIPRETTGPAGLVRGDEVAAQPIADVLKRQHQVITRSQALASGFTGDMVNRRARKGGPWQRLLPGVYLALSGTPTQDQRETAALLYSGPRSTITGLAALRRHGLRTQAPESLDVLIPAERRRQSAGFAVLHRTTQVPERVCYLGPVQFTLPARAVADAARWLDDLVTVRALVASSVQTRLCTIEQLAGELRSGPIQGSAHFRAVLAEVIEGIQSPAESEARDLIKRSGLPMPMFNARLYAGDEFVAIPDAWWPDYGVAAEVDSKAWHLLPEHWERTVSRHDRMTALGIMVLHFTPRQIRDEPEQVLATIRQALISRRGLPALPIRAVPANG